MSQTDDIFHVGCGAIVLISGIALALIPVAVLIYIIVHWF